MIAEYRDTNGRRIRPGDTVTNRLAPRPGQITLDGEAVRWQTGTETSLDSGTLLPLTITHRSGEPIDDISPLVRDQNGEVIERGAVVRTNDHLAGKIVHISSRWGWVRYDCDGDMERRPVTSLTIIPPTPPKVRTTVTLIHAPEVDARKLAESLAGVEVEG